MYKETIGNRIKQKRKEKKITQTQLANALNKSLSSIQKYESGEVEIPYSVINDIAKALATTSSYILGYDLDKELEDLHKNFIENQNEDNELLLFKQQLKQLGCSFEKLNCTEQNNVELKYNNSTVRISQLEFENLHNSFKSYMKFMLLELIKKYK